MNASNIIRMFRSGWAFHRNKAAHFKWVITPSGGRNLLLRYLAESRENAHQSKCNYTRI